MRQRLGGGRRCVFPETGEPAGLRDRGKRGAERPGGFRIGEGKREPASKPARPLRPGSPAPPCPPLLRRAALQRRTGGRFLSSPLRRKSQQETRANMPLKHRGFEGPMSQGRPPQQVSSAGRAL
ncbi:uncharacterized protein PHA67_004129 [Liasis olivaceus]